MAGRDGPAGLGVRPGSHVAYTDTPGPASVGSNKPLVEVTMLWRHRYLVAAAFVLAPCIGLAVESQVHAAGKEKIPESDPFGRLTVDQVERRLGRPNVYVFDGNAPKTYAENHLPGAVRINHKDITAKALPQDKDATLVFYCMNEL